MGTCYVVICHKCKMARDLDKAWELQAVPKTMDELEELADSVRRYNYRAALIIGFMNKHNACGGGVSMVSEHDDRYFEYKRDGVFWSGSKNRIFTDAECAADVAAEPETHSMLAMMDLRLSNATATDPFEINNKACDLTIRDAMSCIVGTCYSAAVNTRGETIVHASMLRDILEGKVYKLHAVRSNGCIAGFILRTSQYVKEND